MKAILKILTILLFLTCCSTNTPDWIIKSNHAISPDGNAYIYQSSFVENDSVRISIATWIKTSVGNGGAGILDLIYSSDQQLELSWESDSIAKIKYPKNARIIRMENSSYFGGRETNIKYETKK
ncbi:MAG: hypothetical protein K9J13_07755 [Saprospiraceae bacterium]|nr:hypothetical protein [Saprospiraceae bacterium]